MQDIWKTAEGCKRLATSLLALALMGIAAVLIAGHLAATIQGPGTLGVSSAGTLWIGVNDEVWVLDSDGRLVQKKSIAQLGIREVPSNIVPLPDGNMLLASRGDAALQVLDARSLALVKRLDLQWPDEFRGNARAIHVAVSPQGQFAVATGGGHAVLLFDADGRFLRRTAPDTFYFTNGIRYSADGWWTTDTNRSRLHLLDLRTLEVRRTVSLDSAPAAYPGLGELTAGPLTTRPAGAPLPLATVTRLGFLMESGYIADVFADGSQVLYNDQPLTLRDIAWFNGELVAAQGRSFRLLRFSADRTPRSDLGHAAVQSELAQMRDRREALSMVSSRWGFLFSFGFLLAGIAAYGRHKKLATGEILQARAAVHRDPSVRIRHLAWLRFRIHGMPIAARFAAAIFGLSVILPLLRQLVFPQGVSSIFVALNLAMLSVAVPVTLVAIWQLWRHDKLMLDASLEPVLNRKADQWLHEHADWEAVAESGESPRESIHVTGWNERWLLVTNARILIFAASSRERRLQHEWRRNEIVYARSPDGAPGGRKYPLWRRLLWPVPNLELVFIDGTRLALRCASSVGAARTAQLLMMGRARLAEHRAKPFAKPHSRRWGEVVGAFLLPGAGQWMQRRFVTGTVFFTGSLMLCLFVWGPVLWAATGPKMHVGAFSKIAATGYWAVFSLAAAADAFRFSLGHAR